jgi:tetratricopeptide (TPR) repeat protein
MFRLLIILSMLAMPLVCKGQWIAMRADADSLVREGIHAIYNTDFERANSNFTRVIQLYPSNPAGYFLDAMIDWWKIHLERRNLANDRSFLEKIDRVLNVCNANLEEDKFNVASLFFKGGALGFRGRFHAVRENMFSAANDGKEAYDILIACQKIAPSNHDIMLGTGLYNYFAVALPEKYPMLSPLMMFLPSGDKRIGLLQLNAAMRQARYAAVEAQVVLLQAMYEFEKDIPKAKELARSLHERYPRNAYFHRYLGRILIQAGPADSAESMWRQILINHMDKKFGYDKLAAREALYYIGLMRMIAGDLQWALTYLYKSDEANKHLDEDPSGFMVRANIKIGQIYDLQGKRELAIKQYDKVLLWKDVGGSHSDARRYKQEPYK